MHVDNILRHEMSIPKSHILALEITDDVNYKNHCYTVGHGCTFQAALALFGMIGGPVLGLFMMGIIYPCVNRYVSLLVQTS